MSGATESLSRQIGGAKDLSSIVRSMKALAASSVGQYERAVGSLRDYSRTVELALSVCLRELGVPTEPPPRRRAPAGIVVIGSDQGLVGRFNEVLVEFLGRRLEHAPDRIVHVWAVGARIEQLLPDANLPPPTMLGLPYSVEAITPLVAALLIDLQRARDSGEVDEITVFHNRPIAGGAFEPVMTRLLPLDAQWERELTAMPWPTTLPPDTIDGAAAALPTLIRSYLFVVLFQACAQSLASENASRLAAMQRAEDNIRALLQTLTRRFQRLRQEAIDEELFEVISGYEALSLRQVPSGYA